MPYAVSRSYPEHQGLGKSYPPIVRYMPGIS